MNDRRYLLFEPTEFALQRAEGRVPGTALPTRGCRSYPAEHAAGTWTVLTACGWAFRRTLRKSATLKSSWMAPAAAYALIRRCGRNSCGRGWQRSPCERTSCRCASPRRKRHCGVLAALILSDDLALEVPPAVQTESDLHSLFSDPSGFSEIHAASGGFLLSPRVSHDLHRGQRGHCRGRRHLGVCRGFAVA